MAFAEKGRELVNRWKLLIKSQVLVAFLVAVGLFLVGQVISSGFGSFSNVMNILSLSSFLGIIALGQTLVILSGGEGIDLSLGAIISLSAVVASQLLNGNDVSLAWVVPLGVAMGLVLGLANGVGVSYFKIPPLIMTLAMASVIQGIALIYTDGQPKGMASPLLITVGTQRTAEIPNILFVWIVVTVFALFLLRKTSWGLRLYGMGENNLTAELSGIRTRVLRTWVYGVNGAVAAFGGILLLGYTSTSYLDIGSAYVMPSVAAVVIGGVSLAGGVGSYLGTAIGAVILTTLGSILIALKMGEAGRQVVYGAMLLLLLILYARQTKK